MATLSLAVNLVLYFIGVMHMNAEDSSNLLTNYMGASYMIAVLISVFADVFVGRYMTVILSSLVELVVRTNRMHACAVSYGWFFVRAALLIACFSCLWRFLGLV
jgi:dipeptide/tripeptide permease